MKHIGGQAVIEGVMMKGDNRVAVSVRLKNGKIKTKKQRLRKKKKWLKFPFIRGISNLIEMLVLGVKTLLWSADQQLEKHEKITKFEIAYTLLLSFGFAILFFVVIPFFLTKLVVEKGILFNIVDGILRIVVFLVYLGLISLMKDIKILFRYHGAEHKSANCYEAGKSLTIANIKKFSTLHPRCGTSFILIVLIISIIVFSFIVTEFWWVRLVGRIVLIPVIAAISYEILKLGDRFKDNKVVRLISAPGLWLQKITTKEPNKKQIEVAVKALKAVI